MKSISALFLLTASLGFSEKPVETWTGRLVDALCKASSREACAATKATHLFAIELADASVLTLDAAGNEKADDAIRNAQSKDLRTTVTGSQEGQTVKVATIEVQ